MSHTSPRSRAAQLAAALTATLALAAITAPGASAGSYEQVTRANGTLGDAPVFTFAGAVAASDTGRYAIVSGTQSVPTGAGTSLPRTRFWLRDIVADTTRQLGDDRITQIFGFDASEASALVVRKAGTAGATEVAVQSTLVRTASKKLLSLAAGETVYAAISGNGRTVVVAPQSGVGPTRSIDVATGRITQLTTAPFALGAASISDDGRVIAGSDRADRGVVFVAGRRSNLAAPTIVAPNGSVVVHAAPYDATAKKVLVRRVATGAVKEFAYPAGIDTLAPSWIAPDGSKVRLRSETYGELGEITTATYELTVATGAFVKLGGPYAAALAKAFPLTEYDFASNGRAWSRNGKYGVLGFNALQPAGYSAHVALVDVAGGDLPGAQEPLTASAYVGASPAGRECNPAGPGGLRVRFAQPETWLPRPKTATVTVSFDQGGTPVTKTFPNSELPLGVPSVPTEIPATLDVVVPATATKVTLKATVVDADGRTVVSTDTTGVVCAIGF